MGLFTVDNSALAHTRIYEYASFEIDAIKTRASIPAQSNIIVNSPGGYADCYRIDTRLIATLLGESITASIATLSASANVNLYSHFSPREWFVDAGVLTTRVKTVVAESNFAGYNHVATAPLAISSTGVIYPNDPSQNSIEVAVYLGELDWATAATATNISMVTKTNGVVAGYVHVPLTNAIAGSISLTVTPGVGFNTNQVFESEIYLSDGDENKICSIPNIGLIYTQMIAETVAMVFNSTDDSADYQAITITTGSDDWTITSAPSWVETDVYRGGVLQSGPFLSGDELRIYPSTTNAGVNRSGVVLLSEAIQINVTQQGGVATATFEGRGAVVVDSGIASLSVNATIVPISFRVVSGLGALNTAITYRLWKVGFGYVSGAIGATARDNFVVNGAITGLSTTAIENGYTYIIYVDSFE